LWKEVGGGNLINRHLITYNGGAEMSSTTSPVPAVPQEGKRRSIKRKLDDSILKKASEALGLPLETHDDDKDTSEPSLKWRKPRHNTEEGKLFIEKKEKRRKEDEEAGKISKRTPKKKDDDKKCGKKKKNKKKKRKSTSNNDNQSESTLAKNPESIEKHGMGALSYLQLWSTNRDHWKFEKLKQTWLLKNCLDVTLVDDKRFEILVEYIGSVKGGARKATLAEMQTIVTKHEMSGGGDGESSNNDNPPESNDASKSKLPNSNDTNTITPEMYDRARQIFQMLADE